GRTAARRTRTYPADFPRPASRPWKCCAARTRRRYGEPPAASSFLLLPLHFLEAEEVRLLHELLLFHGLEAAFLDFLGEHFLAGADVVHHPVGALALNAVKVDEDYLAAGLQGRVDRGHRLVRELEVVVRVADEGHVDRTGRQLDR